MIVVDEPSQSSIERAAAMATWGTAKYRPQRHFHLATLEERDNVMGPDWLGQVPLHAIEALLAAGSGGRGGGGDRKHGPFGTMTIRCRAVLLADTLRLSLRP